MSKWYIVSHGGKDVAMVGWVCPAADGLSSFVDYGELAAQNIHIRMSSQEPHLGLQTVRLRYIVCVQHSYKLTVRNRNSLVVLETQVGFLRAHPDVDVL